MHFDNECELETLYIIISLAIPGNLISKEGVLRFSNSPLFAFERVCSLPFSAAVVIAWLVVLTTGCTSIGPHPTVSVVESEKDALDSVDKILVLPTLGVPGTLGKVRKLARHQAGELDEVINIVPANALDHYGRNRILVVDGVTRSAKNLGMPEGLNAAISTPWLIPFFKWVQTYETTLSEKGADAAAALTKRIDPPKIRGRLPEKERGMKRLARVLERRNRAYRYLEKVGAQGSPGRLVNAYKKTRRAAWPAAKLGRVLFEKLNVTYLLVSYIDGSKKSFEKDDPVRLYVALINPDSGRFRYLTRSEGRKSDLPTTFPGLITIMTRNTFKALAEQDGIAAEGG